MADERGAGTVSGEMRFGSIVKQLTVFYEKKPVNIYNETDLDKIDIHM